MKRLRKHPRIDVLGAQQRAGSVKWSRLVYLGLVSGFTASLAYFLAGDTVVLSMDGMVLRDRVSVGASYPAKVVEVFVKEGDRVEKGAPLLRLESFDMVRELADLGYRDSELAIREGQLRGKLATAKTILPLAARTASEINTTLARFDTVAGRSVVTAVTKNDTLRGSLAATERLAELEALQDSTATELALVSKARVASSDAVERLERIYDEGHLRAGGAGIIGARIPMAGQVVSFGDELMQINGGKSYLLAYLPDRYMFSVHEGMAVNVSGGGRSARGRIDAILPVADALPAEFQNMFRPRDRSRLARISLDDSQPFAVSQKVTVGGCAFGYCWAR